MKTFEFVAWDLEGNCKEGHRQAPSQDDLLTQLRAEELTPAVVNEVVAKKTKKTAGVRYKRVKSVELATFCWQLNTMLSGGLSITVAIQTIADEIANPYFEYILKKMAQQIEKGMSFTDCMRQYPKVFGKLCCAIIMAGETGGSLTESLARLAEHYENRDKLGRKVKGAMAYPAFVVVFIVLIVVLLMTLIIPQFSVLFEEFNGELPAFTRGFMAVYDWIVKYTIHIMVTVSAVILGLIAYTRTTRGHVRFSKFMLSLPVFGKIILMSFVAMFCKTLGTLIGAGVSVLDAFGILAEMTNNDLLRDGVLKTREKMAEGKNISQSMEEAGFFPGVAVKMAQIGENSGSLGAVMDKTSQYYEKKVDSLVSLMLGMLEPALIISVGSIVLVVILAMYLPIFSMSV